MSYVASDSVQYNHLIQFNSFNLKAFQFDPFFEIAVSANAISNMEVPRWRANQNKMAERLASRAADTLRLPSLQRAETQRARVSAERDLPDPQKIEADTWCCLCGKHEFNAVKGLGKSKLVNKGLAKIIVSLDVPQSKGLDHEWAAKVLARQHTFEDKLPDIPDDIFYGPKMQSVIPQEYTDEIKRDLTV